MNSNTISVKIVGVKQVDFTNDAGQRFQSTKCGILYDSEDDSVTGCQVLEVRLPYDKFDKFKGKTFPINAKLVVGEFNLSKQTFKFVDVIF